MKLTVFAASGGIGRAITEQAIAAGHCVTAVVRNPARLGLPPPPVRVVQVDLRTPSQAALSSAVEGADAVLSGLGPRSSAEVGVAEAGTRGILAAMLETGVRRLIVVSAAPVATVPSPGRPAPPRHDPGDGFFMRYVAAPLTRLALRRHYADLARMEDLLRASSLSWTVFRPPRLINRRLRRRYRTAIGRNLRGGMVISRVDVAQAMLAAIHQPETINQTVGIAY